MYIFQEEWERQRAVALERQRLVGEEERRRQEHEEFLLKSPLYSELRIVNILRH